MRLLLCQERVNFNTRAVRGQLSHPPYPPIASQSIFRDVPLAQARVFRFPIPLFRGVAKAALYLLRASREHILIVRPQTYK